MNTAAPPFCRVPEGGVMFHLSQYRLVVAGMRNVPLRLHYSNMEPPDGDAHWEGVGGMTLRLESPACCQFV